MFGTGPLGAAAGAALASACGIRTALWLLAIMFAFTRLLPPGTSIRALRAFSGDEA